LTTRDRSPPFCMRDITSLIDIWIDLQRILTDEEFHIVKLCFTGHTYREIASYLGIGKSTVHRRMIKIRKKVGQKRQKQHMEG